MEVINAVLNYCLAYNLRIKKFISIKNYKIGRASCRERV